jgi:hypothetical protein
MSFHAVEPVDGVAPLHQRAQLFAGARQARHDRAHRHVQYLGGFLIGQVLHAHQQQDFPLLGGQGLQAAVQVAHLQAVGLGGAHRRVGQFARGGLVRPPAAGAHPVDEMVVHDAEHPGAQLPAPLPARIAAPCALERVLDQVVGPVGVARQPTGIAPQAGDAGQDQGFVVGAHGLRRRALRRFRAWPRARLP